MGEIRTGTVGYSYRDWAGIFYPQGTPPRRQFNIYAQNFDVCELTQFTHQMPDPERMAHFANQIRTDFEVFVRLHNTFTHCADVGLALAVAKHFRKAMEPLVDAEKLAGLVAPFPYAFKNTAANREYIKQLAAVLDFGRERPLQLDFRHPSWNVPGAFAWAVEEGLGIVCVDEPDLPGLVPPIVAATAERVLVRLHGRNREAWWSGNAATRYDYLYSDPELDELKERYAPLLERNDLRISFLFQNNWQGQSIQNALEWKQLVASAQGARHDQSRANGLDAEPLPLNLGQVCERAQPHGVTTPPMQGSAANAAAASVRHPLPAAFESSEDDALRPPTSLPLSEVKSRVTRALSVNQQEPLDLPPREN